MYEQNDEACMNCRHHHCPECPCRHWEECKHQYNGIMGLMEKYDEAYA